MNFTPVDWKSVFPDIDIEVVYSSLTIPDQRTSIDSTIAEVKMPGDKFLDISWDKSKRLYVVRLYSEYFENKLGDEIECATPHEVIEASKLLWKAARPTGVCYFFLGNPRNDLRLVAGSPSIRNSNQHRFGMQLDRISVKVYKRQVETGQLIELPCEDRQHRITGILAQNG